MQSTFMESAVTAVHIAVAIILMISVLLQTGKGSGLGAAFGGSSSSVFGSRGPAGLIAKITAVAAVIFMVTSLTLALYAKSGGGRSVITEDDFDAVPVAASSATAPAVQPIEPANEPATEPAASRTASDVGTPSSPVTATDAPAAPEAVSGSVSGSVSDSSGQSSGGDAEDAPAVGENSPGAE